MRSLRFKEVLTFVRSNPNIFRNDSNNYIRSWIFQGLENGNLFFVFDGKSIAGIIEWYRYKSLEELIWDFKAEKLNNYSGNILYINNYIFRPQYCGITPVKQFLRFQLKKEPIKDCFIMRFIDNKFKIRELKIRRK